MNKEKGGIEITGFLIATGQSHRATVIKGNSESTLVYLRNFSKCSSYLRSNIHLVLTELFWDIHAPFHSLLHFPISIDKHFQSRPQLKKKMGKVDQLVKCKQEEFEFILKPWDMTGEFFTRLKYLMAI